MAIVAAIAALGSVVHVLWPLAIALAVLVVAGLAADAIAGPPRRAIDVCREEPDAFTLRHTGTVTYSVANASRVPVRVAAIESPVVRLNFGVDEAIVECAAYSAVRVSRPVTAISRGSGEFGGLYWWFENPLGLLRRRMRKKESGTYRVYPDLSAVERYGTLNARNKLIEAGLRRMRLRGGGTEPESVREWAPGDAFRAVDWKATARRGKLMVAQYEVERSQNVVVMLDAGRLMTARANDQRKFDYAVTAAISVAAVAAMASDKVGVVAFASKIIRAFAPRAAGRVPTLLGEELYDIEPRFEESDYDAAFAYVRTHVRKRSLIVFFTDMVDPAAQSAVLAQIGTLARRHAVVCAFMNDEAIDRAIASPMNDVHQVYEAGVALELRSERRAAAAALGHLGVQVIDVPAAALTTSLIDRYLQIKQRGLI